MSFDDLTRYLRNLAAITQTRDAPDHELMAQFVANKIRRPAVRIRRAGP